MICQPSSSFDTTLHFCIHPEVSLRYSFHQAFFCRDDHTIPPPTLPNTVAGRSALFSLLFIILFFAIRECSAWRHRIQVSCSFICVAEIQLTRSLLNNSREDVSPALLLVLECELSPFLILMFVNSACNSITV